MVLPATPASITVDAPIAQRKVGGRNSVGTTIFGTTTAYPSVEETDMAATFSTYRVVGYGMRVRSSANYSTVGGRLHTFTVPNTSRMPRYNTTDNAYIFPMEMNPASQAFVSSTTTSIDLDVMRHLGLPPTGTGQISSSTVNYPTTKRGTVAELLASGGVEMVGKETSPHSKWFRNTDESSANFAFGPLDSASAGGDMSITNATGYSDLHSMAGWTTLAVSLRDLPANTSFEIEVCWLLEGVTSGARLLSTNIVPVVDVAYMNRVDSVVAMMPDTRPIGTAFGAFKEGLRLVLTKGTPQNRIASAAIKFASNALFGELSGGAKAIKVASSMVPG